MSHKLSMQLRVASIALGSALLVAAALAMASPARAAYVAQPPTADKPTNEYCLSCHSKQGMVKELPSGETLSLTIDQEKFDHSVHNEEKLACVDCHTNITSFPHPSFEANTVRDVSLQLYQSCQNCHAEQYNKVLDSVHQKALAGGNFNAAVCTDCHNPHQQTRLTDKQTGKLLPDARLKIPQTCARCHSTIYDTYKGSVHGAALVESGNQDVPTCIDCHGVHNIQNPTDAAFRNDIPQLCAKCHTDPQIMGKYGISTNVLNTYVSDFHGTTVTLFQQVSPGTPTNKPVCTDCHGVHDISKVDNPATGIAIKQNLLPKCQRCHPTVTTDNFTDAWMSHYVASPTHFPLVYYVNMFYKFFIPAVIGGMLLFVIVDVYGRIRRSRKGAQH
ncbi:MAG TPA: cytochrome c3 family protein [Anaerolineales bacterium]|nr:cytochrome c3 family protein [Anaerolineales bacterium]